MHPVTPNMRFLSAILFLTALAAWLLPHRAQAQTFRVASGVNSKGHATFMEVFEFDFVEEKPEFPGGSSNLVSFINKERRYPAEAYAHGVQGRVMCSFIVNTDGSVSHLSVLKGVEPTLNKEALRIVSLMPPWNPGKNEGRAVPVRVVCTIPFRK